MCAFAADCYVERAQGDEGANETRERDVGARAPTNGLACFSHAAFRACRLRLRQASTRNTSFNHDFAVALTHRNQHITNMAEPSLLRLLWLLLEVSVLFAFTIALQVHAIFAFGKLIVMRISRNELGGPQVDVYINFKGMVRWCLYRTIEALLLLQCVANWNRDASAVLARNEQVPRMQTVAQHGGETAVQEAIRLANQMEAEGHVRRLF